MFELIVLYGLVLGLVELGIGIWALKEASETGLSWMKAFAVGVIILGLGQLLCKVIIQGFLGQSIGMGSRVGTVFSFIGLLLVLYSILEAVDHPHKKLALQIALILGAYYAFGAMLVLGGLGGPAIEGIQKALGNLTIPIFFYLPHILFQTLVPFGVAYLLYDVYKETGDKTALMIAVGIAIYGTAAIAVVSHLALSNVHSTSAALRKGTMMIPLAYDVAVKIIGLVIILNAFRQIAKAYSQ
ncbi:hypothetical protein IPA_08085 [Ignicoccus pacificus DSM 13166]|uniref:Uncharacterized protein n=1 Tax=Ignicoccus pacificus DSM 13166 TaxID=940294 RepID=A0A977KCN9_9CREN|nr:hypothetical protein IPA_08085 [Ignicoccus pacificus DSM 13166]